MSTFTTITRVDLDAEWVEGLLVTAFDRSYGGCNYWLNELAHEEPGSPQRLLSIHINGQVETDRDKWTGVTLWFEYTPEPLTIFNGGRCFVHLGDPGDGTVARVVSLTGEHLEQAWAQIVDGRPIRADLVEQFTRSAASNDLDVDADAADCLVQYALFGQVVYG